MIYRDLTGFLERLSVEGNCAWRVAAAIRNDVDELSDDYRSMSISMPATTVLRSRISGIFGSLAVAGAIVFAPPAAPVAFAAGPHWRS